MFGKRPDGRRLKNIDPIQGITGFLMKKRYDSMNFYEDSFNCEPWDRYIAQKHEEGIELGYMHIVIAGIVRMLAKMPRLNRFVMNGKLYARDKIWISFTMHPKLTIDCPDTTVKLCFEGTESLLEIARTIDEAVAKERKAGAEANDTSKLAGLFTALPSWLLNGVVSVLMWMDRHNCMPKSIIDFSPFHTSCYVTNLKSLGIGHVFHHTPEFGTTGLFFAMGKEKKEPVVVGDQVVIQKRMGFGFTSDERFCDGLYFALAMRQLRKIMRDPALLEIPLAKKTEDIE